MDDSNRVEQLVATKPEIEVAIDLKGRLEEALKPVLALFDEAAAHGLTLGWVAIAPGPYLKYQVQGIQITKKLV